MVEIKYVITDPLGLHARPAGQLVKAATRYPCDIQIGTEAKMVDAKRILGVMGLSLKQGTELTMTFCGAEEETAAQEIQVFLAENL